MFATPTDIFITCVNELCHTDERSLRTRSIFCQSGKHSHTEPRALRKAGIESKARSMSLHGGSKGWADEWYKRVG